MPAVAQVVPATVIQLQNKRICPGKNAFKFGAKKDTVSKEMDMFKKMLRASNWDNSKDTLRESKKFTSLCPSQALVYKDFK